MVTSSENSEYCCRISCAKSCRRYTIHSLHPSDKRAMVRETCSDIQISLMTLISIVSVLAYMFICKFSPILSLITMTHRPARFVVGKQQNVPQGNYRGFFRTADNTAAQNDGKTEPGMGWKAGRKIDSPRMLHGRRSSSRSSAAQLRSCDKKCPEKR